MASRDEILRSALELSTEERWALIRALAASLELDSSEYDERARKEWTEEIARRAREVLSGEADTVDAHRALEEARRELSARRRK